VKTRDNRDPEDIIKELQASVEALRAARKPVDPLQALQEAEAKAR